MKTRNTLALGIALLSLAALITGCSVGKSYDVVVVGSGEAGLSAAIEAAGAGAKVAVIEKMPMVGGSTLLSGGIVYGTGSAIQQKLGIKDSVDDLVKYWSERAEGANDPAALRFVAERSGATIDWLSSLGVQFNDPVPAGLSPVPRGHTDPKGGADIVAILKKTADAKKVDFFMETTVTKLISSNGAVTGLVAKGKDGKDVTFTAKAVVLATGGFDRNQELMAKYAPDYAGVGSFSGVGNTGDGLTMALAVGAATSGHGGTIGFRGVPGEQAWTTDISFLVWLPTLFVNKEGKRFVNESADYPVFHQELNKQTDKISYEIFDSVGFQPAIDKAIAKGVAFSADTLPALATAAGIDPKAFTATVAAYNKMIAKGKDSEFGKTLSGMKPIAKSKFYAVKVQAYTIGTMTGLKIDLDTHVLNAKGEAIKGLFAAGEVANGDFFNQVYPASGTSLQMSTTFGRVAGQQAAALSKK